jgi:hypothetical protein
MQQRFRDKSRELAAAPGDKTQAVEAIDLPHFRTFGFVVLRQFFDPIGLAEEIDQVLHNGVVPSSGVLGDVAKFQYVPMMTAETPMSLSLLNRAEAVAKTVLDCPVLPTRAKAVRYSGDTSWHTDSNLPIASIGFAAYLEPLGPGSGALRVLPGSHRPEFSEAIRALGTGIAAETLPAHVVATEPGDMIVFDEHLFHSSCGGGIRRQWRADYVSDPTSAEAEGHTRSYFSAIFPSNWDGYYDVERYPSYGPDWQNSGRVSVSRLEELGVYEFASRQEEFMRSRRRA